MNFLSQKYVFPIILTAHECTINTGFKTQTLRQVSSKSARVQGFPTFHSVQIHISVEGITHRS